MHAMYHFVVGPLAWTAFAVFICGSIYRLYSMYQLAKNKDPQVLEYMDAKFGLRSIFHWSIPFVPVNSQKHPFMTVVTFTFHICLILTPIFLMAHIFLWEQFHGVSFWYLPDSAADVMTVLVILGAVFFAVRRAVRPEVRYVTSWSDWVILLLAVAPFLTGFLAYHQVGPYKVMLILHILSGEIWLAAIPFTRLSHMLFAPISRAYIGSEFGAIRHAKDW